MALSTRHLHENENENYVFPSCLFAYILHALRAIGEGIGVSLPLRSFAGLSSPSSLSQAVTPWANCKCLM